jgi:LysR family glycine cleavage system transcriptional activator
MLAGMRKLPPLNAVRAFEAAGRHISFTKAAAELNVTHGAISRHVALLEEWIGKSLFKRTPSQLVLTEAGHTYRAELTALFDRLSVASLALKEDASSTIRINAQPTFTMRWLIPRMSGFQRRRPDVEIRLTTSIAPVSFQENAYDVAIRNFPSDHNWSMSQAFMSDLHLPVCHADLIDSSGPVDPRILEKHALISYSTMVDAWQLWKNEAGCPDLQPAGTLQFEQMYFAIQAAAEGLGVVIAPLVLVLDEIIAGQLVAPFGLLAARRRPYYACYVNTPSADPLVEAFCEWLLQEGRDSERSAAAWIESMGWEKHPFT